MIEYRFAKQSDLKQIAQIHKQQFKTHYLGQFSSSLLEDFYSNLLNRGYVFLVGESEGNIVGFVIGGEWDKISESLHCFMKKNLLRGMVQSVFRPKTWKKSLNKCISLFRNNKKDSNNLDNIESFTLLSIAIDRSYEGKGIGTGLVLAFNEVIKTMTNRYYLSVQDTNARAISFYEKMGFVEAYRCDGEIQMVKEL